MSNHFDAIRDARTLGIPRMLLLGLQHMFAMFGATILVPILVNSYFHGEGLSIQVTLFFAGIGTLFFHVCSKLKVPAFLGSSFAFLGGCFMRLLPSFLSTPSAKAGRESVIRLIQRIWLDFKGDAMPKVTARNMVMISPRLEDNRKITDFRIFS